MSARYLVTLDGEAVLRIEDAPGPLVSTAPRRPGMPPTLHAFLSATALDARQEHTLRGLLEESRSTDDFVRRLRDAGYSVARGG